MPIFPDGPVRVTYSGRRSGRGMRPSTLTPDAYPIPSGPLAQAAAHARHSEEWVTNVHTTTLDPMHNYKNTVIVGFTSDALRLATDNSNPFLGFTMPQRYESDGAIYLRPNGLGPTFSVASHFRRNPGSYSGFNTVEIDGEASTQAQALRILSAIVDARIPKPTHLSVTLDDVDEAFVVGLGFSARQHAYNAVRKDAREGVGFADLRYAEDFKAVPLDAVLKAAQNRRFGDR